jgi:4-amino-4-deoxy-L-arabinose transferase-like glycosyltransferase
LFLDGTIARLSDPSRGGRTVAIILIAYTAVWTLYAVIAKSSQDVHFDMGEAVVWSHEALAGTPKHPPLSGWLVGVWFAAFPRADWAYYLFAMVLAAIALWAAWKVSAGYLSVEKRIAGLALLTFVPFYNFHALKYNANAVMLPFWALTTWAFVRSYESRRALPAALAGLAAAGAMLGKYWSVILLAGLAIAALSDPRRWLYLRSRAPWITVAVGLVVLSPHLLWLSTHASTFTYALDSHPGTIWTSLRSGVAYVIGACAYAGVPIIVTLIATRPSRAAIVDTVWPPEPARRFAVVALVAPIVLPLVAALAAESLAVSLWSIGGLTLLSVVLLSSSSVTLPPAALRRIVGLAVVFPIAALLASPVVAYVIHRKGLENFSDQYSLVARAVDGAWARTATGPVPVFGSYDNLLYGGSFYFRTPPKTLEIVRPDATPWTTEEDVRRLGIAMVCPAELALCMNALEARAAQSPRAVRSDVELARRFFGIAGKAVRYVIVIVPPQASPRG